MAARGLLANPAMFTGYEETPLECIWDWVDISLEQGTPFTCFHHHLIYMLERVSSQPERKVFNSLSSTAAVIDYLQNTYGSARDLETWMDFILFSLLIFYKMILYKINKQIYVKVDICLFILVLIILVTFKKWNVFPNCPSGINKVFLSLN